MHQTKKGNQWYPRFAEGCAYGMKVHAGVDKDSGLIHSVVVTAANVYDLTQAADLLHGDEQVVYADAGYQGIANRPEMAGKAAEFRHLQYRPTSAGVSRLWRGQAIGSAELVVQSFPKTATRPYRTYKLARCAHHSCHTSSTNLQQRIAEATSPLG
jgi:hypothetical protein